MDILLVVIFVFLVMRLLVAAYNYYSRPYLQPGKSSNDGMVSILIPARNEATNMPGLLNSILEQDISNYEVLVLDDCSTDDTYGIVEGFSRMHPKFTVLRGKPLADGWLGKNFACWQLAQVASGKYLIFLDADVNLSPRLISSAIHRMQQQRLSLLSLFCNQDMQRLGEQIVVPLMNYLLLTLLPIRLISRHLDPIFSAACGQFMLFDAESYHCHQWHKQVRAVVAEDLLIMKLIKRNQLKGEGLMANGLMSCRMYKNYNEAVDGFSKNFIAPFNNSIPLFMLFLAIVVLFPLLIFLYAGIYALGAFALLVVSIRYFTSMLSGQPIWRNIILHPLQIGSLLWIGCLAIRRRTTRSGHWKGRRLSFEQY